MTKVDLIPFLYGDGRYGYVDAKGASAGPQRFQMATTFHEGLAAAADDDDWGFVDATLAWQVPPTYARVGHFVDGKAVAYNFKEPWLGPIMGLILKQGELTTDVLDRGGVVVSRDVQPQNYLPDTFRFEELFDNEHPQPRRDALPPIGNHSEIPIPGGFDQVQTVNDANDGVIRFLAVRNGQGPWSVYDDSANKVADGFTWVGEWASEDAFSASTGANSWFTSYDHKGKAVSPLQAAMEIVYRDGLAIAWVADVGPVWVGRNGTVYADLAYIKQRHDLIGRPP